MRHPNVKITLTRSEVDEIEKKALASKLSRSNYLRKKIGLKPLPTQSESSPWSFENRGKRA